MIFDQSEFDLRCEWGDRGVTHLAPISDVVVIVDVLSFSTSVEIATNNGAIIFPYEWKMGQRMIMPNLYRRNWQAIALPKIAILSHLHY
jgi:hypothetical protein